MGESQARFGTAISPSPPGRGDQVGQLRVARAVAQGLAQVDAAFGIKTEEPSAIGRQPAAIARATKRRGRRRHNTERRAVGKAETLGRCRSEEHTSELQSL